jgi:hypothetical protein
MYYKLYMPSFDGATWFYYTDVDNQIMTFATPEQAYVYSTNLTRKGMWGSRAVVHNNKGEVVPFGPGDTAGLSDEDVGKANF